MWENIRSFLTNIFTTDIMKGKSLADYVTLDAILSLLGDVAVAIVILLIGLAISRWVGRRIRLMAEARPHLDNTLFKFLSSIARYVILGFTCLFILNTFGIQTTSIVAAIGAAGLAVGLALQGTLSNVAAGVMIILFRPFREGDFVKVSSGETGTVKEISINYTELASVTNTQIIVPNAKVWGNTIENFSSYGQRQAEWTFSVPYDVSLDRAQEVIRKTIAGDARTKEKPDMTIMVSDLAGSSVDLLVRAWVSSSDYFVYQGEMKQAVKQALDQAKIDIPFPTRTLQVEGGGEGDAASSPPAKS